MSSFFYSNFTIILKYTELLLLILYFYHSFIYCIHSITVLLDLYNLCAQPRFLQVQTTIAVVGGKALSLMATSCHQIFISASLWCLITGNSTFWSVSVQCTVFACFSCFYFSILIHINAWNILVALFFMNTKRSFSFCFSYRKATIRRLKQKKACLDTQLCICNYIVFFSSCATEKPSKISTFFNKRITEKPLRWLPIPQKI